MANGVAALRLVDSTVSAPAAAPAKTEIEAAIGEAVASATAGLCFALFEYQDGGLRPETKRVMGERVAAVVMLQLAHEDDHDFAVKARGAKCILRQCFDADYLRRYTTEQADAAVDLYLDELLAVVSRVVATERAVVRAMAH